MCFCLFGRRLHRFTSHSERRARRGDLTPICATFAQGWFPDASRKRKAPAESEADADSEVVILPTPVKPKKTKDVPAVRTGRPGPQPHEDSPAIAGKTWDERRQWIRQLTVDDGVTKLVDNLHHLVAGDRSMAIEDEVGLGELEVPPRKNPHKPHRHSDGREDGLMVTLAIAMVVKDVEKKTEHRSDEEEEIPQYVHKSQLTYRFVEELGEHCTEIADLWSDMAYCMQKKRKADGEPQKSSAIGARAKRSKPNVSASPAPGKRSAKSTKATRSSTRRR
ncbi:uncharacterized protein B0H18DRAFT_1125727 [Fomitopsis serialis]|uniref:uncharacterized protein n=1 Tax=Fomitopsis serialis TaxID=139415 RepID=UPI002008BD93|nr:uncharacterized protein B0H18DRAFT_1125727 [Neoantrodia serialis]KAH9914252.1 hypothetical protein B0H18DRAFT_1125727 [Neoantrodia serialis]